MAIRDELGNRMKKYYEEIPKAKLMRRCPVILRCDGKAFHTFTRNFVKPFDEVLIKTMQETTKYLCENIKGCVLGYTQSDEITLVLIDYKDLNSQAWFDYEIQKLCSIAASMATMAFNQYFYKNVSEWGNNNFSTFNEAIGLYENVDFEKCALSREYIIAINKVAMFDCRCFNIPKEEVTNCLYWRQLDASRNSIQMVGQAYFSHKELQNKSCNEIQDMLMTQKGINWNDFPTYQKRGSCCIRVTNICENKNDKGDVSIKRSSWVIDKDIPIFKEEGREYIDGLVFVGE